MTLDCVPHQVQSKTSVAMLHVLEGHADGVCAVSSCTVDGRVLVLSGSYDHTVKMWDAADGTELRELEGHTDAVLTVASCTVDGRVVVLSGSVDKTVRLWDAADGRQLRVLGGHTDDVCAVTSCSLDGRVLVLSASDDRTVRMWDAAEGRCEEGGVKRDATDGTELSVLWGHLRDVNAVASCTVDGRTLVLSGSWDHTVRMWDVGRAVNVAAAAAVAAAE